MKIITLTLCLLLTGCAGLKESYYEFMALPGGSPRWHQSVTYQDPGGGVRTTFCSGTRYTASCH